MLAYLAKDGRIPERGKTFSLPGVLPDVREEAEPAAAVLRLGESVVPPSLLDLSRLPRVPGRDFHYSVEPRAADREDPLGLRQGKMTRSFRTMKTQWNIQRKRPLSGMQTQVQIIDQDGKGGPTFSLPAYSVFWQGHDDRDYVVSLGEDWIVRRYHETGSLQSATSLRGNPEIMHWTDASDSNCGKMPYVVRAVDIDKAGESILFTVNDAGWLVGLDGSVQWGYRFPGKLYPSEAWDPEEVPPEIQAFARAHGLRNDLTPRELASMKHARRQPKKPLGPELGITYPRGIENVTTNAYLSPDRIELARFTDGGVRLTTARFKCRCLHTRRSARAVFQLTFSSSGPKIPTAIEAEYVMRIVLRSCLVGGEYATA